jgi:hypothetical protein
MVTAIRRVCTLLSEVSAPADGSRTKQDDYPLIGYLDTWLRIGVWPDSV